MTARCVAIVTFALAAAACGSTSPTQPGAGAVQSVAITGLPPGFSAEEKAQLTAIATYASGSTAVVTSRVRWSTLSLTCVIDTAGLLSAVAEGDCTVEALLDGVKGSASTRVGPPKFFTITGVVRERFIAGAPGMAATVTLVTGAQAGRRVTTNADGTFSFAGVPRESVQIRAEAEGFEARSADVSPASATAEFMLEPLMAIDERTFANNPSAPFPSYTFVEIPFRVSRRGPVTVRVRADGPCEVSYSETYSVRFVGISPTPSHIYGCDGRWMEYREILDPGQYELRLHYLHVWFDPRRQFFLSYPR